MAAFPLQVVGYGQGMCLGHGPWDVEGVSMVAYGRGFLTNQKVRHGKTFSVFVCWMLSWLNVTSESTTLMTHEWSSAASENKDRGRKNGKRLS